MAGGEAAPEESGSASGLLLPAKGSDAGTRGGIPAGGGVWGSRRCPRKHLCLLKRVQIPAFSQFLSGLPWLLSARAYLVAFCQILLGCFLSDAPWLLSLRSALVPFCQDFPGCFLSGISWLLSAMDSSPAF